MKQMKIRVLTMVMALMVMMVSVVSAQEYWNGDTNYPRVYARQGVNYYVDLSSAFIADKKEKVGEGYFRGEYLIKYNTITTSSETEPSCNLHTILIVHEKGGALFFSPDGNGGWKRNNGEFGYEMATYNAAKILDKHLF